jgi:hypothetical protein
MREATSEPEADRGPQPGSPAGVVANRVGLSRNFTEETGVLYSEVTQSLPLPVLICERQSEL